VLLRDAFPRKDFFHAIPRLWILKQRDEGYPTYSEASSAIRKFQEPITGVERRKKRKADSRIDFVQNDLKDPLHETSKALNVSANMAKDAKRVKVDPNEWKKNIRCHKCGRKGHIKSECKFKTADKKNDPSGSQQRTDDAKKDHHSATKHWASQGKGRPRTAGLMARLQRDAETEEEESEHDWSHEAQEGPLSYKTVLCKGVSSKDVPLSSCEESCSDDEDWGSARAFMVTTSGKQPDQWEVVKSKRAKRAARKGKSIFRRSRLSITDLRTRLQEKRISLENSCSSSPAKDDFSGEAEGSDKNMPELLEQLSNGRLDNKPVQNRVTDNDVHRSTVPEGQEVWTSADFHVLRLVSTGPCGCAKCSGTVNSSVEKLLKGNSCRIVLDQSAFLLGCSTTSLCAVQRETAILCKQR